MKKPTKIIIWILLTIILVGGMIYVGKITADLELIPPPSKEKALRFTNATVDGWHKGKRIWKIFAQSGWSTKYGDIVVFEKVFPGVIYRNSQPLLKNIKAQQIKYFKHTDIVEAFDNNTLSALIDPKLIKGKSEAKYLSLEAQKIIHDPRKNKTSIHNHISIKGEDFYLQAQKIEIDHQKELAKIAQEPRLTVGNLQIQGKLMLTKMEEGKIEIKEKIEAIQPGKAAVAEEATYEDKGKNLTLKGKVKTIFARGSAILDEKSITQLKNLQAKKALREKIILTCDQLLLTTKNKDAQAEGNVRVVQKDQEAKADLAYYSEKTEEITLSGNVELRRKTGDWLKASEVIVSVKKQTFRAAGKVETEFRIKRY